MTETKTQGAAVVIRDLTVRAGERVLLEKASARFEPGEVALVVGPSGAGKSLLLRVISGLLDDSHSSVDITGHVVVGSEGGRNARVGVVFQHFALFDELSPTQNVAFAHAHRNQGGDESTTPVSLLDELGVPRDVRVSRLSGGQQQRLAIARTLANDPDVVLYDEPTSGLDAAAAKQVATTIRNTHTAHPKTAIVVTHDYESLSWIADRIYLFDANARELREVPKDQWQDLREHIETGVATSTAPQKKSRSRADSPIATLLTTTSRVAEAGIEGPIRMLPLWRSPVWGLRYLKHYLRLVAGPSAWLYLAVTGLILGYVATHFTFKYMPYADYTEPLIKEEVLGAVGYALFRILIPLVGTILIAARCGAAVASDIGNKTYGRQMDALRSLGARPRLYLLTNVLWAFLIGTPLLIGAAFLAGRIASLVSFTLLHPDLGPQFWEQHFHRLIALPGEFFYAGMAWTFGKVLACGFGTALITYHQGARPKPSATSVSSSITSAILWSTLWVLLVHFAFAFIEFSAPG